MNLLIIGAGNMGLTYGQSFVNASAVNRAHLFFLDRNEDRAPLLSKISHNPLHMEPSNFIKQMDMIILSVKPQDFERLAIQLRPYMQKHQLILSIMAGITMAQLNDLLGVPKRVRAMPNLPARVGQGMTVFTASGEVTRPELLAVQNLLNTTGKTLYTESEHMLDAATAISGSGPAYVFYVMQHMMAAAQEMGFSDSEAQLLVRQTVLGSINLLNRNTFHCAEWIEKVSSRGGTTEAAIKSFEAAQVGTALKKGLEAARQRSIALRDQSD